MGAGMLDDAHSDHFFIGLFASYALCNATYNSQLDGVNIWGERT